MLPTLPTLLGMVAFGVVGAPLAHAHGQVDGVPGLTTELLTFVGESVHQMTRMGRMTDMSQLLCTRGWAQGWASLRWNGMGGETLTTTGAGRGVPLLGLGLLGLAAVVVLALGRMRLANEHKRLEVAQRLIEQGMDPPASLLGNPARNDLRKGIVLLFAGGGILAAGLLTADRGMAAGALVPEFIGAGYLVSYWLAARAQRGDA